MMRMRVGGSDQRRAFLDANRVRIKAQMLEECHNVNASACERSMVVLPMQCFFPITSANKSVARNIQQLMKELHSAIVQ